MDRIGGERFVGPALVAAMAAAAALLLAAGSGLFFAADEFFYYANLVPHGFTGVPTEGVEYFLAPHNGHMVVVGRLIYEALFDLVGTNYVVFRAVEVAGILLSVGLFFALARRKVNPWIALAFSISLLFLGYANETALWPFNLHTVYSLAFGLGALLALRRGDLRGDVAACVLLALSAATIELGLAFAVGVAVSVLQRREIRRRAWIFLVPVALYGAWWLWARKFDQSAVSLANVRLISTVIPESLSAVFGSVLGLNPTGTDVPAEATTVTAWGTVAAGFGVALLGLRIARGNVPPSLWVSLSIAITYWITIALGGRAPDTSRYIFVGTVLVFLVATDAMRGLRFSRAAVAVFFAVVAAALPANIAKLYDGREQLLYGAEVVRAEYTMLDLAGRERAQPDFLAAADSRVIESGGGQLIGLSATDYFRAARRNGSLGSSPVKVSESDLVFREIADATLVGALGMRLADAAAPPDPAACPSVTDASPDNVAYFPLPPGGALLASRSDAAVSIDVARFGNGGPGVELGRLEPGQWAQVRNPEVRGPGRWELLVSGPVYVCVPA